MGRIPLVYLILPALFRLDFEATALVWLPDSFDEKGNALKFSDMPAAFGPAVPDDGITGFLVSWVCGPRRPLVPPFQTVNRGCFAK